MKREQLEDKLMNKRKMEEIEGMKTDNREGGGGGKRGHLHHGTVFFHSTISRTSAIADAITIRGGSGGDGGPSQSVALS